jgi:lipopolysaccharide/colanic/teichoic acid biosynthesis glycosyltransferase
MTDGIRRRHEVGYKDARIDLTARHPYFVVDDDTYRRSRTRYEVWVKPIIDRLFAILLLVPALPVIGLCAVAIRVNMGPGILLRQVRVGHLGRVFTLYKLRTMKADRRTDGTPFVGADRRVSHKTPDDPRITPLGRFLRKWSLDELPQLWNVIRGDMSLVGPRPELPEIVIGYETWQHRRHSAKPGLTGSWQISERGNAPLHECTALDIEYVNRLRFTEDVKILVLTPVAVLARRGF